MSKVDRINTCAMIGGMCAAVMTTMERDIVEAGMMVEDGYTEAEIIKRFEPELNITDQLVEASGEIMNIYHHGTERLNQEHIKP